jgi:hypothetical protein
VEKSEGNFLGDFELEEIPKIRLSCGKFYSEVSKEGIENSLCNLFQYLTFFLYNYTKWQMREEFDSEWANDSATKLTYEYIDYRGFTFESEERRKKELRKYRKKKRKNPVKR